jgi:hypothetical protein
MLEIRELVRSGATEMTGKTYREGEKVAGRHGGGFSKMFPELDRAGLTPGQAAAAVELGHGKRFNRLQEAVANTLGLSLAAARKRGRATVPAHPGNKKCSHCRGPHTTGEHRFHGEGAFHRTHMFSFNPAMKKHRKNPSEYVVIYGRVTAIEATKTQKHNCDDECKAYGHRYRHDFKTGPIMYGLPDGSILIKKRDNHG